jgi:hypothetical protein
VGRDIALRTFRTSSWIRAARDARMSAGPARNRRLPLTGGAPKPVGRVSWPLALVVLADDQVGRVGPAELQAHVKQVADRGLISRYAVPERLLIVDAIEKTSVGKIDKRALRERYQPS